MRTQDFELTPLVNGDDDFSVEYDVTYDPHGNYRMEGQIIGYGAPNMAHDVELMDILSPSDNKLKSRFNPVCEHPVVLIRNTGSEPSHFKCRSPTASPGPTSVRHHRAGQPVGFPRHT